MRKRPPVNPAAIVVSAAAKAAAQAVEKPLRGFSTGFLQSAARIICPRQGDKFHTCSLRSVFCQVRAPVENGFDFICPLEDKLCETFLTRSAAAKAAAVFLSSAELF